MGYQRDLFTAGLDVSRWKVELAKEIAKLNDIKREKKETNAAYGEAIKLLEMRIADKAAAINEFENGRSDVEREIYDYLEEERKNQKTPPALKKESDESDIHPPEPDEPPVEPDEPAEADDEQPSETYLEFSEPPAGGKILSMAAPEVFEVGDVDPVRRRPRRKPARTNQEE